MRQSGQYIRNYAHTANVNSDIAVETGELWYWGHRGNRCALGRGEGRGSMPDTIIRRATVDDVPVVARHRVAMFCDMGQVPTEAMAAQLLELSLPALGAALRDGSYVGWLAVDATGDIVAGAGVHIKPQLPRPAPDHATIASGPVPLVLNSTPSRPGGGADWRGR
jgi:hypothetical protein